MWIFVYFFLFLLDGKNVYVKEKKYYLLKKEIIIKYDILLWFFICELVWKIVMVLIIGCFNYLDYLCCVCVKIFLIFFWKLKL